MKIDECTPGTEVLAPYRTASTPWYSHADRRHAVVVEITQAHRPHGKSPVRRCPRVRYDDGTEATLYAPDLTLWTAEIADELRAEALADELSDEIAEQLDRLGVAHKLRNGSERVFDRDVFGGGVEGNDAPENEGLVPFVSIAVRGGGAAERLIELLKTVQP